MPREEDVPARTLPTLTNSIPWEAEADASYTCSTYVCTYSATSTPFYPGNEHTEFSVPSIHFVARIIEDPLDMVSIYIYLSNCKYISYIVFL